VLNLNKNNMSILRRTGNVPSVSGGLGLVARQEAVELARSGWAYVVLTCIKRRSLAGRCGKVTQQKQHTTQEHPSTPRGEASFDQLKEHEECRSICLCAEDIGHWGKWHTNERKGLRVTASGNLRKQLGKIPSLTLRERRQKTASQH